MRFNVNNAAVLSSLEESEAAHAAMVQRKKLTSKSRGTRKRTTRTPPSTPHNTLIEYPTLPVQSLEDFGMECANTYINDLDVVTNVNDDDDTDDDDALVDACLDEMKRRRLNDCAAGRPDSNWVMEPSGKPKKGSKSLWVPTMDKWSEDFNSIRKPGEPEHPTPSMCFGCKYEQAGNAPNLVYVEKWDTFLTKFREITTNCSMPSVIATDLHKFFVDDFVSQLRRDNYKDAAAAPDRWPPYTMLYHMWFHNSDTHIAARNKMAHLHELQDVLRNSMLYEENALSGRKKVSNKDVFKMYLQAIAAELPWTKVAQETMSFSTAKLKCPPGSATFLSESVKKIQPSTLTRAHGRWG